MAKIAKENTKRPKCPVCESGSVYMTAGAVLHCRRCGKTTKLNLE